MNKPIRQKDTEGPPAAPSTAVNSNATASVHALLAGQVQRPRRPLTVKKDIALAWLALCIFLYVQSAYSFVFLVVAVFWLSPGVLDSLIDALRHHRAIGVNPATGVSEPRPSTPGIKLMRHGIAFIMVLVLAVAFRIATWIAAGSGMPMPSFPRPSAEYLMFSASVFFSLLLMRKRRYRCGELVFFLGLLWVMLQNSVALFLNKIGVDSLTEAQDFDFKEAQFWLSTIGEAITLDVNCLELISSTVAALISFLCLRRLLVKNNYEAREYAWVMYSTAWLLIGFGVVLTVNVSLAKFLTSSTSFLKVSSNFSAPVPAVRSDSKKITVVVYIGESTTVMNMSLYGYPRNTTPLLAEFAANDANLIVFKNVFSTHTHTSQSLLEALSFDADENQKTLPIEDRKRVSLVDVAKAQGPVLLYSNQGTTGYYNRASSVIFRNAERTFSSESRLLGDAAGQVQKTVEHEFFKKFNLADMTGKSLVFLHSYAGHGAYLSNIPPSFAQPVDQAFSQNDPRSIFGTSGAIRQVEQYDSAMRYVDFSVSDMLRTVKDSLEPAIVVYFSDHGESVYGGRGHDSARFMHEMLRIPFLIYFNEAARKSYPEKYGRYRALARESNVATLAQLSSTIINLMGLELIRNGKNRVIEKPLIGEKTQLDPVLVRRTNGGTSYINLNAQEADSEPAQLNGLIDRTDEATRIFKARHASTKTSGKFCYGHANSLAKALRGALLTDCIGLDVVAHPDGSLAVYDPPAPDVGLKLSALYRYVTENNLALWIDGKNVQSKQACDNLSDFLHRQISVATVLVDFPSGAYENSGVLGACAKILKQANIAVSYRVSAQHADSCSQTVESGKTVTEEQSCVALKRELESAYRSGLFTDFSFQYGGRLGMEQFEVAKKLAWNIRDVPVEKLNQVSVNSFRMIMLNNTDPNSP